ncbi:F-box only protein 15 isoform X2 [Pseudophryne corroboree]|uniref:F-box only protein 15 isoform X2 n=1 Tax=Pseudophryne corroboree TaxID=495146 RepID=UPI003081E354
MATGRGWINQQHIDQMQRLKSGPVTTSRTRQTCSSKVKQNCTKASNESSTNIGTFGNKHKHKRNLKLVKKMCVGKIAYIESLPSEILLKILSYLDPISLMCIGSVNKQFYELSKDNLIWYNIFCLRKKLRWDCISVNSLGKKLAETTFTDKQQGYWKKTYINEIIAGRENRINKILRSAKNYSASGVPANMEKAVKMSGLIWALTFKDVNGKETVIEQTDIQFRDTSLTITWNSYLWPVFTSLTTIQLHGITPVLIDKCLGPCKIGLRRLSLIVEYNLMDPRKCIGQDKHVKLLYFKPGLLLGLWKSPEIAFVMATLHYHNLLEKSFWGSPESPYTFPTHIPVLDDVDSEYGLHGYRLHIDMYSGPRTYLCRTFRGLFCRKEYIKSGYLQMTAIGIKNNKEHAPLVGKVDFLWDTLSFSGSIQNCFMMDVTLLDETDTPYWCFSSAVELCPNKFPETLYDFMGQSFNLNYKDSVGRVYAELIWMKETEEYYLINLKLYLNTEKVNSYFGTNYTDYAD